MLFNVVQNFKHLRTPMFKKMRFSIRTILVVTAVLAIWVGFLADRMHQLKKEAAAIESLDKQWYLDLDCSLTTGFQEPEPNFWSSWVMGDKWTGAKRGRVYKLGIHNDSEKDGDSLAGLSAISQLGLLYITHGKDFRNSDFKEIGKLSRLEDLKYSGLSPLTKANISELGKLKRLEDLSITALKIETLDPLAALKQLRYLNIYCRDSEIPRLSFLRDSTAVRILTLSGNITIDHIRDMQHAPNLGYLDLSSTNADDSFVDELLKLNLGELYMGDNTITMSAFNKLRANIQEVTHVGLKDFKLNENYFQRENDCYELDLAKCKLFAELDSGEDAIFWSVNSYTTQLNAPDNSSQSLTSPRFRFKGSWKELVGKESSDVVDVERGNLYDGIHTMPVNCEFKFLSRDKNRFHIQLDFENDWGGGKPDCPCQLNAILPFEEVVVWGTKSIDEAKQLFSKHFDLSEFKDPKKGEDGQFVFPFKTPD